MGCRCSLGTRPTTCWKVVWPRPDQPEWRHRLCYNILMQDETIKGLRSNTTCCCMQIIFKLQKGKGYNSLQLTTGTGNLCSCCPLIISLLCQLGHIGEWLAWYWYIQYSMEYSASWLGWNASETEPVVLCVLLCHIPIWHLFLQWSPVIKTPTTCYILCRQCKLWIQFATEIHFVIACLCQTWGGTLL